MIIQIVCALVPLALILLFIKEKIDFNRFAKIVYCMVLAFLGILILALVVPTVFPTGVRDSTSVISIMMYVFLFEALPEELFKFLTIKKLNAKNKKTLIKDIFITSTVFMFFENIVYSKNYTGTILFGNIIPTAVLRMFIPMHLLSQIIMAYFMIKAYNEKDKGKNSTGYFALSLTLPIIIHTLYNIINRMIERTKNFLLVPNIVCLLGIITYILTFIFIRKMMKKYSTDNQEVESISINRIQLIVTVLFIIFWLYFFKM